MRTVLLALLVLPFTGCDRLGLGNPEEVKACRVFAQAGLSAPSTYTEASVRSFDNPIAEEEVRRRYFPDADDELQRMRMDRLRGRRLGIRSIFLSFDAANAYGTPLRQLAGCDFLLVDGELASPGMLESDARAAAMVLDTRRLAEALDNDELRRLARPRGGPLDCCIR